MELEKTIEESMDVLARVLHPVNFDRVKQGNLGYGSFVYFNNPNILRISDRPKMFISIGASAGDDGYQIDPLHQFQQKSYEFGRALGEKAKEHQEVMDIIFSTGGCHNILDWVTKGIRDANPEAILLAFIPFTERMKGAVHDIRLSEDPRDVATPHLSQYDILLGTHMDVTLRSVMVGTADLAFFIHGGAGSLIEIASIIDQCKIAACYDIGGERGVVKNVVKTLESNYRNGQYIFFKNSDENLLIKRAFAEYEAKTRPLWAINEGKIESRLTSIVLYQIECTNGKERYFINIRKAALPVTYYHRRWGEHQADRYSDKKVYHPIMQYIAYTSDSNQVIEALRNQVPDLNDRLKNPMMSERGEWARYHPEEKHIALALMENLPEKIGRKHIFYEHIFERNLAKMKQAEIR